MNNIGIMLFIQVVLIALNAVFSCAEIAVISVNETKLENMAAEGNKKAQRLFKLTREPARFLSTIQIAITLAGFLGSAFAADTFSDPLVDWLIAMGAPVARGTLDTIALIFITLVLSYFTLIFGELVPKRIAMKKTESIALGLSGIISVISELFRPIVALLSVSTNAVLRLLHIDPEDEEENVSEDDIIMMLAAGSKSGSIDEEDREFIQNVFEFDDITAGDIATHRTDITLLSTEDSDSDWKDTIYNSRYNLYPVCNESADDIFGVLNAKDYFRLDDRSRESVMKDAIRPAYFVPETVKADVLFRSMRANGFSMAVVLDENGGMVGIVTMSDLLEELVGDINDEDDSSTDGEPHIEKTGDNSWIVTGNVLLEDLEDATGADLENDDFDTITGLVFSTLDMIPEDGAQDITADACGLHVHVTYIQAHQVFRASVSRIIENPDDDSDAGQSAAETEEDI